MRRDIAWVHTCARSCVKVATFFSNVALVPWPLHAKFCGGGVQVRRDNAWVHKCARSCVKVAIFPSNIALVPWPLHARLCACLHYI